MSFLLMKLCILIQRYQLVLLRISLINIDFIVNDWFRLLIWIIHGLKRDILCEDLFKRICLVEIILFLFSTFLLKIFSVLLIIFKRILKRQEIILLYVYLNNLRFTFGRLTFSLEICLFLALLLLIEMWFGETFLFWCLS